MDRETTEGFGWLVVMVLAISVLIALAFPVGKYISDAVSNTGDAVAQVGEGADYNKAQQEAESLFTTEELSPENIYG